MAQAGVPRERLPKSRVAGMAACSIRAHERVRGDGMQVSVGNVHSFVWAVMATTWCLCRAIQPLRASVPDCCRKSALTRSSNARARACRNREPAKVARHITRRPRLPSKWSSHFEAKEVLPCAVYLDGNMARGIVVGVPESSVKGRRRVIRLS